MTSTDPAPDPAQAPLHGSLRRERAHHDVCRAALAAMIDGAREHVVTGADVSASGADAEVLGYQLRSKAKELGELPEGPLFFGRLDFDSGDRGGEHSGASYHLGRLRISEHPTRPPLVVDWRAPVSRAFYQASARDPQGVAVRRRFGWAPGSRGDSADLTGLEDEHLDERRRKSERDQDRESWRAARTVWSPGRSRGPASAPCGTSPRRSSPSRTTSYGRASASPSACRAPPAPARRPSGCTGPPTSSTRTPSASSAAAC